MLHFFVPLLPSPTQPASIEHDVSVSSPLSPPSPSPSPSSQPPSKASTCFPPPLFFQQQRRLSDNMHEQNREKSSGASFFPPPGSLGGGLGVGEDAIHPSIHPSQTVSNRALYRLLRVLAILLPTWGGPSLFRPFKVGKIDQHAVVASASAVLALLPLPGRCLLRLPSAPHPPQNFSTRFPPYIDWSYRVFLSLWLDMFTHHCNGRGRGGTQGGGGSYNANYICLLHDDIFGVRRGGGQIWLVEAGRGGR